MPNSVLDTGNVPYSSRSLADLVMKAQSDTRMAKQESEVIRLPRRRPRNNKAERITGAASPNVVLNCRLEALELQVAVLRTRLEGYSRFLAALAQKNGGKLTVSSDEFLTKPYQEDLIDLSYDIDMRDYVIRRSS